MSDNATSKIDAAAEKAYAEASARKVSAQPAPQEEAPKPAVKVETTQKVAPAPKATAKKPAAKKAVRARKTVAKPAPKKPAIKAVAAKKPTPDKKKAVAAKKPTPDQKKTAPQKKPAAKKLSPIPTATKFKETIMATAQTADFTKAAKGMVADVQTKLESAYAKTSELTNEANAFGKANVEAVVESGKILFSGLQELGRENVENGKDALETVTTDVKKMAAAKTPTDFMQLQGELARRNFDAAMSFGSKRTEALVKLYSDAFAPISSRVSVAAEKIKKVA